MLKIKTSLLVLSTLCIFLHASTLAAQPRPSAQYLNQDKLIIPNIQTTVEIDGVLDEPVWQKAGKTVLDNVMKPFNNIPAPDLADVYYFENDDTLFVGFVVADQHPEKIRASYVDRDQIWGDDLVGIKLDTFNDAKLAYQFFINPLGIQSDGIQNEMTGNESDSWNTIWESKGQITASGYTVEVAIPLSTMNFDDSDGEKQWGVEFVRFLPRENVLRISHLAYDRNNSCDLCQMGQIKGFANAQQGNNLDIVPTLVVARGESRELAPTTDWVTQNQSELGLDVKWGITPDISLQATFNPDFSQVESDVAQVSVNNTFALFFSEKRPFFVENSDYFTSNYNLVYTRNINAPDYGLKLTGRSDKHALGVFFANDDSTNFLVPGNLGSSIASLESKSNNLALRYRYDVTDDISVGWISTIREADDYHNYVAGVDVKYTPTAKDNLRIQWVHSDTEYPEFLAADFCDDTCTEAYLRTDRDEAFTGQALRINYSHNAEDYFMRASHYRNGADFRGDLGFVSRVDRNSSVIGGGLYWWNQNSWWDRIRLTGDWDIHHNDDGELLEKEIEAYLSIRAKYETFVEIGRTNRVRVGLRQDPLDIGIDGNAQQFSEYQNRFVIETKPTPKLGLFQMFRQGDQIDFTNNRVGQRLVSESMISYKIGAHLNLRAGYEYRKLEADAADVFTAKIINARATYQFDSRQFLRLIMSLAEVERNPENYIDTVTAYRKDLGLQLLYSYKVNPLTKFFIGYSDAAYQDDEVLRLRKNERSLFMKFSYAWSQ